MSKECRHAGCPKIDAWVLAERRHRQCRNRTWHLVVSHPCPFVQPCCKCRNCCFFCSMLIYSWHFHGQKYGTAKNASIRNRGDAYENLTWICVTGHNGFVKSAWMFSFLQCDVYWMTGPPFLCESASIDKATSLWRLLIEVADGWFGKDSFVRFRTTCMSRFGTYCWMSMR